VAEGLILYTIGHSNLSPEVFLEYLHRNNIMVLVDVRSAPYSRYVSHFNKANLEAFLKANGVDYRFAGEYLGGQPKDESVYKNEQLPNEDLSKDQYLKRVDYVEMMKRDWYLRGIRRLLDILRETEIGNVAIMCSEGNPRDCHRHHLITRSLLDSRMRVTDVRVEVRHIVRDGEVEMVNAAEFEQKPEQPKLL
jgi:uncharacterized protein (DUF488 family)